MKYVGYTRSFVHRNNLYVVAVTKVFLLKVTFPNPNPARYFWAEIL